MISRPGRRTYYNHYIMLVSQMRTCGHSAGSGTLVRESSGGDEILAMRLLRDTVPGVGDRYVTFPLARLKSNGLRSWTGARFRSGGDGGESISP